MKEDLVIKYFYDQVLGRNVYGVPPEDKDIESILDIIAKYNKLSEDSKAYLTIRLEMLKDSR